MGRIIGYGSACVLAVFLIACGMKSPSNTPTPTQTTEELVPREEPNGFCATSRLGKTITIDGIVYTCKGPKPYRWREDK